MSDDEDTRPNLSSLTAASMILEGGRSDDPSRARRNWQEEAWSFYDTGPLRYGTRWVSNLLSKARLRAGVIPPGQTDPEPLTTGPAAEAMDAFAGGLDGQSALLRSLAIQLTVPGMAYLIGEDTEDGGSWRVLSADAIRMKAPATPTANAVYEIREESDWVPFTGIVVKVWYKHERHPWEADSPARAALSALREHRRISQYIDATLVSRLAGAGIFVYPAEATFPSAKTGDGRDPFVTEIIEVMMTAVREPGTAAQVVPIPVKVPGEFADKFSHMRFETELSEKILDMRESALREISITLDIPAEILTGLGDVNHWTAWQVEESAVKVHAEPLLAVITSDIRRGYLVPVLEANGVDLEEIENTVVWADVSEMTSRPDRSDDAILLYDRGEAKGESLRREVGLSESDKMDDGDTADWAYRTMIKSGAVDAVRAGLQGLGIPIPDLLMPSTATTGSPVPPPVEEPDDEERGIPDTGDDGPPGADGPPSFSADPRVLVLEGYVQRALEVARNRSSNGSKNTPPFQGAWTLVTQVAGEMGLDPSVTVDALESYCATVLEQGLDYDRRSLAVVVQGVMLQHGYRSEVAA